MNNSLDTPCVGVCSTVYGDDVCRGCKRLYQEVIEWNSYDDCIKAAVLKRLHQNMSEVVKGFLTVNDPVLLLKALHLHKIRYQSDDPYCWAHHLLRVRAAKIIDITQHGIEIKAEYQSLSFLSLFTQIDKNLHEKAHLNYVLNVL